MPLQDRQRSCPSCAAGVARNLHRVRGCWRREQSFVDGRPHHLGPLLTLGVVREIRADVGYRERLPAEGRNDGGEGLGWPRLLAWNVGLRHLSFFDRPQRLARHAVEDVEETRLPSHRDGVHALAVAAHLDQLRRSGVVVIPEVVMDDLIVPEPLASPRVQREQTIAEQVAPNAIGAIEVVGG